MAPTVRAFVQARMSSRRFPGKVLAPFRGVPLILHVLRAVERAAPPVVATSGDRTDDPLAAYVQTLGVPVFRGPLDDVFERFRLCARAHPCEWVLRICADSPLLDPALLEQVVAAAEDGIDVVTTVRPRTIPHGQSAELIRVGALEAAASMELEPADREHVTPFFYRHPDRFTIRSVGTPVDGDAPSLTVDTIDDLDRLSRLP